MDKLTILDGGMGRELKRIGAPFSQPYWSAQALIESPHYVKQAHQSFVDAGAEIITVNSYACVPFHLEQPLYDQRGAQLAELAAKIAREVADNSPSKPLVAGSLPPPLGSYRPDLFEQQQAHAILSTLFNAQQPYVDIWLAETVSSLAEAKVITQLLASSDKPCYISLSIKDEVSPHAYLRSGERVSDAVNALLNTNTVGIFFNCSIPEVMAQAIKDTKQILSQTGKPITIGVFANSFAPIGAQHAANGVYQELKETSPQEYLEFAKQWYQLGARVIGGCCGIGPEHIETLSAWRDSLEQS